MSNDKKIYSKLKYGFKEFSDYTSIHGFTELYRAKSGFWKMFWILCIAAALGTTVYQSYGAVNQYFDENVATLIQPVKQEDILYPAFKLCYGHWVYWVSFEKGFALNFTRESMLYGFSIMTKVFSATWFNITEARQKFVETLKLNNMTRVSEFYVAVSKYAPLYELLGESFSHTYPEKGGEYFNNTELMNYKGDAILCHVIKPDEVKNYIKRKKDSNPAVANINYFNIALSTIAYSPSKYVTPEEYSSYMAAFLDGTNNYWLYKEDEALNKLTRNFTVFKPPMYISPDGGDQMFMLEQDRDIYKVRVSIAAQKWRNTKENPCDEHTKSMDNFYECIHSCESEVLNKPGTRARLEQLLVAKRDQLENLYTKEIYFMSTTSSTTTILSVPYTELLTANAASKLITTGTTTKLSTKSVTTKPPTTTTPPVKQPTCYDHCLQSCEKWNVEISLTSGAVDPTVNQLAEKRRIDIQVLYPADLQVLKMIELDAQSWENFVGNVGGLIGIWTGASILSLIQLIYLCCCTENDKVVMTTNVDNVKPLDQNEKIN